MNLDIGGEFDRHFRKADVLNNEGVDFAFLREAELVGGSFEFTREDEGIHGEEAFHSMFVQKGHQLGQVVLGEVVGAQASVEGREAKVDGVCTGGDGSAGAVPVAGWGEEFGCKVRLQEGGSVDSIADGGKALGEVILQSFCQRTTTLTVVLG